MTCADDAEGRNANEREEALKVFALRCVCGRSCCICCCETPRMSPEQWAEYRELKALKAQEDEPDELEEVRMPRPWNADINRRATETNEQWRERVLARALAYRAVEHLAPDMAEAILDQIEGWLGCDTCSGGRDGDGSYCTRCVSRQRRARKASPSWPRSSVPLGTRRPSETDWYPTATYCRL